MEEGLFKGGIVLRTRVITSIILLLIIVPAVLYGGWPFRLVMAGVAIIACTELIHMAKISRAIAPSVITYVGTLSIVFYDYLVDFIPGHLSNAIIPVFSVIILLICTVLVQGYDFTKAGVSGLTMFYVGLGGYSAITIRNADLALFLFILFVIYTTDIGAYFIGSKIGKRKLAPRLSPNKTIEGSLGGTLLALVVAAIYLSFFSFNYTYGTMLVIAVILSITGQFGDLLESAFKRHFGVKDSGHILPGHGGILDRFDSTLFTLTMALMLGIV